METREELDELKRLQEEEAVSRLCLYFGIGRQAYYKSNNQMANSIGHGKVKNEKSFGYSLFTSFVIQNEAMNLYFSGGGIPHYVRNDIINC